MILFNKLFVNSKMKIGSIFYDENDYKQQIFYPNMDNKNYKYISKNQYDDAIEKQYYNMLKMEDKKRKASAKPFFQPFFQLPIYIYNYLFTKVSKLTPI